MHIPDGFLSGEAAAVGWVAAGAGLAVCTRKAAASQRERDVPLAGLAAAYFLVADAPLVPISVGTQGHLLGGTLAVALLGPWLGALTITVVVSIQAIALGDGGISTLGLTIFNLALVPALVGYPLIVMLRRRLPKTGGWLGVACAIAAFVSVVLASVLFVSEFALAAVVPIELHTVAWSTIGSFVVIGAIEAVITALIVRALLGLRPDLVRVATPAHVRRRGSPDTNATNPGAA
jgi:cobalt/nickel transport system permease protein